MFNQELRARRAEMKHTQQSLADALGVKRQSVNKWEKGRSVPESERWQAIEIALRLPGGWIAERLGLIEPHHPVQSIVNPVNSASAIGGRDASAGGRARRAFELSARETLLVELLRERDNGEALLKEFLAKLLHG